MWATWCKPCIEEMPRLASWQSKLTARGLDVALVFINADESDEVVAAFRKQHPGTPDGPRLADASALGTWLEQLGVGGATLPVHVFVDTQQRVRCVRASAVDDADYDAIATLLGAR
jgi:thiol-disulfide isomerase/thioredoxin